MSSLLQHNVIAPTDALRGIDWFAHSTIKLVLAMALVRRGSARRALCSTNRPPTLPSQSAPAHSDRDAVAVVNHEGAARATLLPPWSGHEVLHQQLPATFEQFGERAPTLGRVEDVVLVDADPGQLPAQLRDLVAPPRQSFSAASRSRRASSHLSCDTVLCVVITINARQPSDHDRRNTNR